MFMIILVEINSAPIKSLLKFNWIEIYKLLTQIAEWTKVRFRYTFSFPVSLFGTNFFPKFPMAFVCFSEMGRGVEEVQPQSVALV